MNILTLVNHQDIQSWVAARRGLPGISRSPDHLGEMKARLVLSFPSHEKVTHTPSIDDGMSPCSWTAWLAELDRQRLALRVIDSKRPNFELVPRSELN